MQKLVIKRWRVKQLFKESIHHFLNLLFPFPVAFTSGEMCFTWRHLSKKIDCVKVTNATQAIANFFSFVLFPPSRTNAYFAAFSLTSINSGSMWEAKSKVTFLLATTICSKRPGLVWSEEQMYCFPQMDVWVGHSVTTRLRAMDFVSSLARSRYRSDRLRSPRLSKKKLVHVCFWCVRVPAAPWFNFNNTPGDRWSVAWDLPLWILSTSLSD